MTQFSSSTLQKGGNLFQDFLSSGTTIRWIEICHSVHRKLMEFEANERFHNDLIKRASTRPLIKTRFYLFGHCCMVSYSWNTSRLCFLWTERMRRGSEPSRTPSHLVGFQWTLHAGHCDQWHLSKGIHLNVVYGKKKGVPTPSWSIFARNFTRTI